MQNDIVSRYYDVLNEVKKGAPAEWNNVIALCEAVPKSIGIDSFWTYGRDKPCWSNIRVSVGERIASDLNRSKDFNSSNLIASDEWEIVMLARGPKWKSNPNFNVVGDSAKKFLLSLSRGGLASYKWRLYAIRQYALSLGNEDGVLPMVRSIIERPHSLTSENIYTWSKRFAEKAGAGWGATTVNHLLTDLGLSVKPDLHLRRSAVRLGLLQNVPSNLPVEEIDKNSAKLDQMVVPAVINMALKVTPTASPTSTNAIREVDKVLMEWSRKGFLRAF